MRILIISKYFPPENSIASLRPYSWAKYWAAAGHEVTVLTTKHDSTTFNALSHPYEGFKVHAVDYHPMYYKLKNLNKRHAAIDLKAEPSSKDSTTANANVSILKRQLNHLNEYRKNRGLFMAQRMPDNMDFWLPTAQLWALQQPRWDLVISTHAPYAAHIIAHALKKRNLTNKWIADFRDLWTDHHIYKGIFPFTIAERLLEKKLMGKADLITTVSNALKDTLSAKYGRDRVHVIENGFDPSDAEQLSDESAFPADGKKRLIYSGTIYKGKQDPSPLLAAIALVAQDVQYRDLLENLEVLFFGANTEVIQELIMKHNVGAYVKSGGFVDRNKILRMQRDADGLIFLEFGGGKVEGILTGKLFEYLYSGTQIWGIGVESTSTPGKLIREANSGYLFGEDVLAIKKTLVELLSNPITSRPQTNKAVINRYNRKDLAQRLLSLVTPL